MDMEMDMEHIEAHMTRNAIGQTSTFGHLQLLTEATGGSQEQQDTSQRAHIINDERAYTHQQ